MEPVDEGFFATAPLRVQDAIPISRPAEEVWNDLVADNTLSWCRMLKDVKWTSPRPFGVGTTRTVRALGGLMKLDERYFVWEEGRRKSFYVVKSSAPGFRRFAEDYLVEPTGEDSCTFTWTVAADPAPLARPGNAVNRAMLGTLFRDTRKHYGVA